MHYTIAILLLFSATATHAQRFLLDSIGTQNGYGLESPRQLTVCNLYQYNFLNSKGHTSAYHLSAIQAFTGPSKFRNITNSPVIASSDSFSMNIKIDQSGDKKTYYIYDKGTGYKLYRHQVNNATYDSAITTNYPAVFNPVSFSNGNNLYLDKDLLYILNNSSGKLQLLVFNTSSDLFLSVSDLGNYSTINPHIAKDSTHFYINLVTDQNIELLCSWWRNSSAPSISVIDTISTANNTGHLSHIFCMDRHVYYAKQYSNYGYELTSYDVINKTTKRITDLAPGAKDGVFAHYTHGTFGQLLNKNQEYILLFNGSTSPDTLGYQLFAYNSSTGKAQLVDTLTDTEVNGKINAKCNNFFTTGFELKKFGYNNAYWYNYPAVFFSAMADTQQVLWMYDGITPPQVVSTTGVSRIIEPRNIVLHFSSILRTQQTYHTTIALNFIGNNDGTTKIYQLIDSAFELSVENTTSRSAGVTAYPNPVANTLHLDINLQQAQTMSLTITDIQGRLVYHSEEKRYTQGSNKTSADISKLPAGTYIYMLKDSSGDILNTGKVIKN